MVNPWTTKSIELANAPGYLDKLSVVYNLLMNPRRPLPPKIIPVLKELFEQKKSKERYKELHPDWNPWTLEYGRQYRKEYRLHIRKYAKYYARKRRQDTRFLIEGRLRAVLTHALKKYGMGKMLSSRKYGIDYRDIAQHLGEPPGNRNKYQIDHIRPLCSFDLRDPLQVKIAFAPENHQWLTVEANSKKSRQDILLSLRSRKAIGSLPPFLHLEQSDKTESTCLQGSQ